jgi:hypothetical protein
MIELLIAKVVFLDSYKNFSPQRAQRTHKENRNSLYSLHQQMHLPTLRKLLVCFVVEKIDVAYSFINCFFNFFVCNLIFIGFWLSIAHSKAGY